MARGDSHMTLPIRSLLSGCAALAFIAALPLAARAQYTWFASAGGGATFPSASAAMSTGWLAEASAGVTLPGNVIALRLVGTYGRNKMKPEAAGMPAGFPAETDRSLGLMGGVMIMPDLDRDLIPYLMLSGGAMNGRYRGSDPSFAWAAGAGARYLTDLAEFYVEGRFVRSTGASGHGDMVPLIVGVRYTKW